MVISQTPFRISFLGGGTDYPAWSREFGGKVLNTTIDKYCYLTVRKLPPFFEHKTRVVYSKIENVSDVGEIEHPAVKGTLSYLDCNKGLEIHHDGDLPARSGIGSSSAFTVGLLKAIKALEGEMISKALLAEQAIHIEQNVINESVGCQDQLASAFGGLNVMSFHKDGTYSVDPFVISPSAKRELNSSLMLFFTGISRISSEVAKKTISTIEADRSALADMADLTEQGMTCLGKHSPDLKCFAQALTESWIIKKSLSSSVTSDKIDTIFSLAMKSGAYGGKLLGAGGGGFVLFVVPKENQQAVRESLASLVEVPFQFENNGSQVVYYNPRIGQGDSRIESPQMTF